MKLFSDLQNSIANYNERDVFFINGISYKYFQFAQIVSRIRKSIAADENNAEKIFGIIANDDIETYAAIIALWFEGKTYVPLSTEMPVDRNENIIQQVAIKTIIDSSAEPVFTGYKVIRSKALPDTTLNLAPKNVSEQEYAYILFTSGTTGQPKGVPITRANLSGFVAAFNALHLNINEDDRYLQMFELTFDLSVMSYLIPMLKGGCIYTIPKDAIKYSYIYELMEEQRLTVALMVPSILQYLRPYFKEINLPDMKYNLFCGEALSLDVADEWSHCLPNAVVLNVYGPTEDTIFCTHYTFKKREKNTSYNGLISIGKAMEGTITIIIDEENKILPLDTAGQLCLGGTQLTPGYWNNQEKNHQAFFSIDYKGRPERFYKTGDLCKFDKQGDILYIGRLDFQIKVQGFRVELSEIEFHAKSFLQKINAVAVAYPDKMGNTEIGLVIESKEIDITALNNYFKSKLPAYMMPRKILFADVFPLNSNGKTDRNKLGLLFKSF